MATISLRLEGEPKGILLDAFFAALTDWFKMLNEVDSAISGQPKGSLDWVITNLQLGSLLVEAEALSRLENRDYSPEVVKASIEGFRQLEDEGLTPGYLTDVGLKAAKRFVKLIGNKGVTGISLLNHNDRAVLTAKASAHIDQVIRVRRTVLGSVEGRLEMLSIHKNSKFVVYHHRTHKAVTCTFDAIKLSQVKESFGRRVIAFGEVSLNMKNEPVRLKVERLRVLKEEHELPTISQIGGSDPDFTGGLSSTEYIRRNRIG